jgi:hypothetical protein
VAIRENPELARAAESYPNGYDANSAALGEALNAKMATSAIAEFVLMVISFAVGAGFSRPWSA